MNREQILSRMKSGKLYYANDEQLAKEQLMCLDMLFEYNNLKPSMQNEKHILLEKMFKEIGTDCYIETPFHANWGGKNVHLGNNVYFNFGVTLVDDTDIHIGNNVMIGPHVVISTGTHPINIEIRKKSGQYNLPIMIHDNVWIGALSIIMPGVTIGKNSIIGAGSIVTKDIPPNVIAVGSPCKVQRDINENDRKYYNIDQLIDIE